MIDEAKSKFMVDWSLFPKRAALDQQFERAWKNEIHPSEESPATPFHISLKLIEYVYRNLLPFLDYKGRNPPLAQAKETDLRAMAYFSWHREDQVFLARRVYPTYFDFLTYSHVRYGWGALGIMLDELKPKSSRYKGYTTIDNVKDYAVLLPYLKEANRLRYETVLIIPVCTLNTNRVNRNDESLEYSCLVGAVAFYCRNKSAISNIGQALPAIKDFSVLVGEYLSDHRKGFQKVLEDQDSDWTNGMTVGQSHDGEINIRLAHGMANSGVALARIEELLLSGLNSLECYGMAIRSNELQCNIYIAAATFVTPDQLNTVVKQAIGSTCAAEDINDFVRWAVAIKPQTPKAKTTYG